MREEEWAARYSAGPVRPRFSRPGEAMFFPQARRGQLQLYELVPARPWGPSLRLAGKCCESRFPLTVSQTREERGGLERLVCVSLPRLARTRATRLCRFHPGRVVASGKQNRRTREKRPRYRGFFRVRSVSSPWGIGVDYAQDCTQAHLARQRLYRVPPLLHPPIFIWPAMVFKPCKSQVE